jgi:hypothetical protein
MRDLNIARAVTIGERAYILRRKLQIVKRPRSVVLAQAFESKVCERGDGFDLEILKFRA